MPENLTHFEFDITRSEREKLNGHKSITIWITGLSGAGKSTIANRLESKLFKAGIKTMLLDGDNIRSGLNSDLGFSTTDREENIRRIGETAKLLMDSGSVVIASFISPLIENRTTIKDIVGEENFVEIYVNTPLDSCIKRDNKGLYAKAILGDIDDFTGISAPYQPPSNSDFEISFESSDYEEKLKAIISKIKTSISYK
ncbi:MAG: adenylyl-sulfate kinase [Crocinitomicaceae bacterium]|nr:adenylyl-sulfate kinase [Crocinitomicaceae bacterium]